MPAKKKSPLPLPDIVPTKISSEAAGFIKLTPVAREELSIVDLIERILVVTGKDAERVAAILGRGSFVSGPSRYRWEAFDADPGELAALFEQFPDPRPERPFEAARCHTIILRGRRGSVEIRADFARRKRLLQRANFWDKLLALVEEQSPSYTRYAYGEKSDVYSVKLPFKMVQEVERQADLLKYSTVVQQIRHLQTTGAELYVSR